jgi:hypothetical protein
MDNITQILYDNFHFSLSIITFNVIMLWFVLFRNYLNNEYAIFKKIIS